ncbi:MAG: RHS repeat domain-containing protein [Flavobacteriales bacterium]
MKHIGNLIIMLSLICSTVWAQKGEDRGKNTALKVLEWEQLVGLEYDKDRIALKNTGKEEWGSSGAFSKHYLDAQQDGQLEFNIQDERTFFALGLSKENKDNKPETIDHGFYFERGSFFIVDKGEVVGEFGNYRRGDHFKIKRYDEGRVIGFFYNNIQVFEEEAITSGVLHADFSLFSQYTLVENFQVSQNWQILQNLEPVMSCLNENDHNWIVSKTYDLDGNVTSESKVFADKTGKTIQSQSKNMATGKVMVAEPIYDAFGRAVAQTLPVPINNLGLCYVENFVQNENGEKNDYTDFDLPNTSLANNTGQINHPKRVGDDVEGKLGWYYSNNNTDEPYVATTKYPYSRVEYSKSNPGQVRRSSAAGDIMRMGQGHEVESYSMPASSELYYLYGYSMDWNSQDFDGMNYSPSAMNIDYQVVKSITVDQDEKEYVSFTDHDGKVLASCRSGLSNSNFQTVESIIPRKGHIDIHIPKHCQGSNYIHYPSGSIFNGIKIRILNLATDKFVMNGGSTLFSYGQQVSLPKGYYRIEHYEGEAPTSGIGISYKLNYERFTLHYYDQAKRLIKTIPPKGIDENYNPNVNLQSLQDEKLPSQITLDEMTIDEPSTLNNVTNRSVHLSFWAYEPVDLSSNDDLDYYDILDLELTQNTMSLALRVANHGNDRLTYFRDKPLNQGGMDGKNIMMMPIAHSIQAMSAYQSILANAPAFTSGGSGSPSTPAAIITPGGGNTGGGNPQVQPYVEYTVNYELGYQNASNNFVVVKDGLSLRIKKLYHFDGTGTPCTSVGITNIEPTVYINGENSALITDGFIDLSKYKVKITGVWRSGYQYNASTCVGSTFSGASSLSNITDEIKFKFQVEDYNQKSVPNHNMEQTYKYNSLNWLLETSSPDEGISKFVYRNDGQIRFSQNARQKQLGHFSYTNYDKHARPIESGEHKGGLSDFIFTDHYGNGATGSGTSTDDIREVTGGFASYGDLCSSCFDRSYIKYDIAQTDVPNIPGHTNNRQTFVAGNIAKTSNSTTATWYSYDHYGRMTWMIKGYEINSATPIYKLWEYQYDGAGNVKKVIYQPYSDDYFAHIYTYDAANRLHTVKTNADGGSVEELQATYIYYAHGPLKRVELATNLQGIDYVYTINGALKSINNPNANYDPGSDGINNSTFNKDQFAMTLDYYKDDYTRSNTGISNVYGNFSPGSTVLVNNYAGSITSQHWNRGINGVNNMDVNQDAYIYKYDAFNQLNSAVYASYNPTPGANPLAMSNNYKVDNITYDKNGNIESLRRNNATGGTEDFLNYSYDEETNQLDRVNGTMEGVSHSQSGDNYEYDASGRLVTDEKEKLRYRYNVQGLVTRVEHKDTGDPMVEYFYDDGGFRYKKISYSSGVASSETLYVRDASGQVASIYIDNGATGSFDRRETPFYGNSRIGIKSENYYIYELKDHLGNVRETFKKTIGSSPTWASTVADYYPFGLKFNSINSYRYGYQGEYAEDESDETGIKANSFQLRLYDPRLGRWLSPDPKGQYHSPYLAMGNDPTNGVDPDGGWFKEWKVNTVTGEKTWVSDKGGDEIEYIHYYGGGNKMLDGKTEVTNLKTFDCQTINSSTSGKSFILDYTERNNNVGPLTIGNEFITGEGSENSLFYGDHPMNKDIQKSPIFKDAYKKFRLTNMQDKKLYKSKFGLIGAWKAGKNITAQMLGKFSTSFYPIGDKVIVLVTDSKSNNSFNPIFKFSSWITDQPEQHNKVRKYDGKYPTALGTTRQTYLFVLSIHE